MVLLGTAILGAQRYAVLADPGPSAPGGGSAQPRELIRAKVGDDIEGFRLTDVGEKRVVFTKGATRVELALDYFRKDEPVAAPKPSVAGQPPARGAGPRPVPNLPRRERLPLPPRPSPNP